MRENPGAPGAADRIGGTEAERSGSAAPRRRGGRPPKTKSGTGEKVRVQFHVSEECDKRLGLHSVMSGQSKNELVETLLMGFLLERGQGQAGFQPPAAKPPRDAVKIHPSIAYLDSIQKDRESREAQAS